MEYICKDMELVSTVDSLPFLQLVQTLGPRYKPSSCLHFTRAVLPAKHESIKVIVNDSVKS